MAALLVSIQSEPNLDILIFPWRTTSPCFVRIIAALLSSPWPPFPIPSADQKQLNIHIIPTRESIEALQGLIHITNRMLTVFRAVKALMHCKAYPHHQSNAYSLPSREEIQALQGLCTFTLPQSTLNQAVVQSNWRVPSTLGMRRDIFDIM